MSDGSQEAREVLGGAENYAKMAVTLGAAGGYMAARKTRFLNIRMSAEDFEMLKTNCPGIMQGCKVFQEKNGQVRLRFNWENAKTIKNTLKNFGITHDGIAKTTKSIIKEKAGAAKGKAMASYASAGNALAKAFEPEMG